VISVQAFLTDTDHVAEFNAVYAAVFAEPYPARTTIYCGLRPGVLVEVSAVAVAPVGR
jgi:2-iminobutanoate/2-iminopropanoate deaminase